MNNSGLISPATTSLETATMIAGKNNITDTLKNNKTIEAARDFESVFISEMLKPMFETVEVDDMFGGGKGEEVFRGIMIQEMGKSIAKQGGFGIADQVKAELLRIQEHHKN
jgi:peptidoglycan hydrolase FlgJ